ncbi:MAG: hypothetical protein IMX00_02280 [Limnochordales bacterium]|nr:hypothetical protein [Limnochordales bacterium]
MGRTCSHRCSPAKSIARFRELEDRQFAEYYLVGTLLSLTLATTGYLALQLLANALPLPPG